MKKRRLQYLIMLTKLSFYGFVLQSIVATALFATDGIAQHPDLRKTYVEINVVEERIDKVLKMIEEQTEFNFVYSSRELNVRQRVTINATHKNFLEVLRELSRQARLKFRQVNQSISIQSLTDIPEKQAEVDEKVSVSGHVYDTEEPPSSLPGVAIVIKGTSIGTVTDGNGAFTIEANIGDVLILSMIGFEDTEYIVEKEVTDLTLSLDANIDLLNEVVVLGLTEQQKRHTASAVASLDVDANIVGKPITTLSQSLQGGITGLQVTQNSGLPGGDAAAIKIRGISTLGNSNPLILVDGVPMDMNHIDPITVESVTVLKDAAAAAIYGARAANGVILVTTKRGVPGKVAVTYHGYAGVQTPTNLPKLVDGATYMRMYNEAQINAGNSATYTEGDIQATASGEDPIRYPDTDWRELMLDLSAPITSHSLSVSGGNALARFAVTGNYMYQKGMIPNNDMKRFNIRANTSITLSETFLINLDLLAIKRNTSQPNRPSGSGGNRILEDIYRVPPVILPRYPEVNGVSHYGHYVDIVNPLAYAERGGVKTYESGQASINMQPKWEVFPGFNLNGQFSFRLNSDVDRTVRNNSNFFDYYTGQLLRTWGTQRNTSMARTTYYYMAANADYTLDLDDHYIFAMLGYSQEENNSGDWNINSMMSSYAKVNYSFKDKYLLEGTVRADGSSKFGPGHKWGIFPSVAVGWNMHNESFLSNSSLINHLKLRASYGQLGNENIGLYRYQTLISATHGLESTYGNPEISWETVTMLNLGLDIGLLENNKLEITIDAYDKMTEDIILTPQLPYVGGFQGDVPINAGEVRNRGWEVSLNYEETINQDLNISFRPGVSYNENEILSLEGGPYITATEINEVGSSIGSIYGYKTDGLLQSSDFDSNGDPLIPVRPNAAPGDIKYLNINSDNILDANDQTMIGNPTPKMNYFANFRLSYKNFDFEFMLQGTGNSDAPLGGMFALPLDLSRDGGVPTTYYANNYWTPDRTDARFPRISSAPTYNRESSDFWFQNGSYLRVKYLQLGYNVNTSFLAGAGISSIRLYVNAQNPFTFTSMKLTDPESRGNQWTYGIMEAYTLGVNIRL